jgi:hypothetical protein
MSAMSAAVSTATFEGSDVDGLDHLAHDCTTAAEVVNGVKAVCEAIVAAASIFGPFGAAFITYLKTVVIPWLTKIAEALQLFAKVLSARSSMQRDASSPATSLPNYTTPANLPVQNTSNYPTMPVATGSSGGSGAGGASPSPVSSGSSTVGQPPAIGATSGTAGAAGSTAAGAAGSQNPIVQEITALTGLVTAVDHLLHPNASGTGAATPVTGAPITSTPVPGTPITGTDPGAGLGGLAGGTVTPTGTAANGDVIGTLQIPVEVSPDGTITPLLHTGDASVPTTGSTGPATTVTGPAAHSAVAPAPAISHHPAAVGGSTHALAHPHGLAADSGGSAGGTGGGTGSAGGGTGGGGSFGGGGATPAPVSHTAPTVAHHAAASIAHATAPAHAAPGHTAPHAAPAAHHGGNHDGLYSGLGQATGLGAGAGAIAKAALHEAGQRADGGPIGATALPFDADSDGGAQAAVYSGVLGQ